MTGAGAVVEVVPGGPAKEPSGTGGWLGSVTTVTELNGERR